MIQGRFGSNDELFFEIELIAADGLELPADALLDTGFSDWLAMDKQDLEGFDWAYLRQQTMLTARGEVVFEDNNPARKALSGSMFLAIGQS